MKINIRDAIKLVKSEAMTNVILFGHMPNLTMEDKMYIMYFIGAMKGKDYMLDFDSDDGVTEFEIDRR